MKKILKKFFSSITGADIGMAAGLLAVNTFYCLAYLPIFIIVGFAVSDYSLPDMMDTAIIYFVIPFILTIVSGVLIRKLNMWLLSLPIQFLVYNGVLYMLFGAGVTIVQGAFGSVSISTRLLFIGRLFLYQIPGVSVRLLINFLLRKLRARKQAVAINSVLE